MTTDSVTSDNLDRMKFELEQRKLRLEELRYAHDNRFFNKNFGVIVTSIISAATIIVSVTQLYISSNYNAGQLRNEQEKNARTFSFDVAKFLMAQRDEILSNDVNKAEYFRTVVVSSFPADVAAQVATSLRDTLAHSMGSPAGARAPSDVRAVWAESAAYSQAKLQAAAVQAVAPTADVKSKLTPELLTGEFKELAGKERELKLLLDAGPQFGIVNKDIVDIYLALVFENSDFLRIKVESLNYSAPRLLALWPKFFDAGNVRDFANNPQAIANKVYGGRL